MEGLFVGAPSNDVNRIDSGHVTVYTTEDKTEETSSVPSSIPSVIPYLASYEDISTVLYSGLSETPSSKLSSLLYLYPSYYLSE